MWAYGVYSSREGRVARYNDGPTTGSKIDPAVSNKDLSSHPLRFESCPTNTAATNDIMVISRLEIGTNLDPVSKSTNSAADVARSKPGTNRPDVTGIESDKAVNPIPNKRFSSKFLLIRPRSTLRTALLRAVRVKK